MITIDGKAWNVPCDVQRTADVTSSDISGMLLDKTYFNDVLGTFMSYSVSLAVPPTMEYEYAQLYEMLTEPVDAHAFLMPYNEGTIEVTARVESVQDTLVWTASQNQYWRGISFTVTANHPSKTMELGEAIARGMSAVPNVTLPSGSGRVYRTADEVYY